MADRTQQVASPAPVTELIASWDARSAERFVAILEPDARVSVPPLHLDLHGRDDVWLGVARLFAAFGTLQYTMRHRYLTPDAVTDEVLLEGVQTAEFLGAPPTGRPGSVAARVMMRHDGQVITELTVWPDVAALRELSDGVARRIDLRSAGPAAPVVAALRASIPASAAKLSVGEGRPTATTAPPDPNSAPLSGTSPTAGIGAAGGTGSGSGSGSGHGASNQTPARGVGSGQGHEKGRKKPDVPRAPLPRKVRRLRAFLAGSAMLVAAALLVTYVVVGVRNKKEPVAASTPKPTPTARAHPRSSASGQPRTTPSRSTAPQPTPSATPSFDPKTSSYTIPNTVLFALNSAELLPESRSALDKVVGGVVHDKRYGRITVTGYTDSSGGRAFNIALSKRRAKAVAAYLQSKLDGRFQLAYVGLGPDNPRATNDTPEHMALNRRVEIKVPKTQD